MTDPRFSRVPGYAGFVNSDSLPKGPNGRALCRWCQTEVQPPKLTFCSQACVDEHKVRTNPGFAKQKVWERDHGVCRSCGLDTAADLKGPVGLTRNGRFPEARALGRWDMDHIVPVVEGGGNCGLENYRTLCRPCHRRETAALRKRLAAARRIA